MTVAVVPFPRRELKRRLPPCSSTIVEQIDNPKPMLLRRLRTRNTPAYCLTIRIRRSIPRGCDRSSRGIAERSGRTLSLVAEVGSEVGSTARSPALQGVACEGRRADRSREMARGKLTREEEWCPRPDSNRHGSPHRPLKTARLPIPLSKSSFLHLWDFGFKLSKVYLELI